MYPAGGAARYRPLTLSNKRKSGDIPGQAGDGAVQVAIGGKAAHRIADDTDIGPKIMDGGSRVQHQRPDISQQGVGAAPAGGGTDGELVHPRVDAGCAGRGMEQDRIGAALRFRRLLSCRDRERDELDHRLRGVLRLACADKAPVDWGVLGVDILWFFAESDSVRRRWAQDFYAPTSSDASQRAATSSTAASMPNA